MGYPTFKYENKSRVLRAPGFVSGQWRQGQKGEFGPRGLGVTVINSSGTDIAADKLVVVVGFDTTTALPKIVLAANNSAGHDDVYVTPAKISNGKTGIVLKGGVSGKTLNTNGITAGNPVYLDSVAGGFTGTAPTDPTKRVNIVGYVTVVSSTVGQVLWDIQTVGVLSNNDLNPSAVQTVQGTIAAADITGTGAGQFGHANGYPIVAAPGAGKAIILDSATASYVFATAAYTGGGNTTVNWAAGGAALTGLVSGANFAAAASSKPVVFYPLSTAGVALVANAGLNLVTASAFTQPGTAAGVINYSVNYQIVTL